MAYDLGRVLFLLGHPFAWIGFPSGIAYRPLGYPMWPLVEGGV